MKGRTGFRHDFIFVILTELSAAETQTQGPYTFRNARLELFQTGIGSTGLRYCSRKFCKNDEDKIMTKTSSTLHTVRMYDLSTYVSGV